VGRDSVRKSIVEATQDRLKGVFAWTQELGVPCFRSAPPKTRHSSFAACRQLGRTARGRGGGHGQMGASIG
jgi:hypothetical protein